MRIEIFKITYIYLTKRQNSMPRNSPTTLFLDLLSVSRTVENNGFKYSLVLNIDVYFGRFSLCFMTSFRFILLCLNYVFTCLFSVRIIISLDVMNKYFNEATLLVFWIDRHTARLNSRQIRDERFVYYQKTIHFIQYTVRSHMS